MALTKCKECGGQISSKAKTCPNCGKAVKRVSKLLIAVIIIVLLPCTCSFWSIIFSPFSDSDESSYTQSANQEAAQERDEVIEIRLCYPIDRAIPGKYVRTGPSMNAPNESTGDIAPHERLYVLESRGDWIRFRVTPKDQGWSAWVPKRFTISQKQILAQKEAKFGQAPEQSSRDNSVSVVKRYLREVAKDPSSLKFESWSEVYFNKEDGWIVYCVFRGKNSFGAYTREANWFVIRYGRVVDVKAPNVYGIP